MAMRPFGEPPPAPLGYWYRYDDAPSASLDEWGDYTFSVMYVRLSGYRVLKLTPKGAWLNMGYPEKRFVLKDANKRFACPTVEEAKASYIARKRKQIRIYTARITSAQRGIEILENNIRYAQTGIKPDATASSDQERLFLE